MAAGSLVIVPEPHKADLRRSQDVLPNGQQQQPVSRSGGRAGVTQAVEVKSSQPIFPGQSPALARTNDGFVASTLSLHPANPLNLQAEAPQVVIEMPFQGKHRPALSLDNHTVSFHTIHSNSLMSYQGRKPVLYSKFNKRYLECVIF